MSTKRWPRAFRTLSTHSTVPGRRCDSGTARCSARDGYVPAIGPGLAHISAANFPAFLVPDKFGKFGKFDPWQRCWSLDARASPPVARGTAKRRQVPRLRASLIGVCLPPAFGIAPVRVRHGERTPSVPPCQDPDCEFV